MDVPRPPEAAFVNEPAAPGRPSQAPRRSPSGSRASISKLSTAKNFWHRVCSFIWLPYAFRCGIRMQKLDARDLHRRAPLPSLQPQLVQRDGRRRRSATPRSPAGSTSSIWRRRLHGRVQAAELPLPAPCFGPAVYQVVPKGDVDALVAEGGEFNIEIQLNVYQQLKKPGERGSAWGGCSRRST